MSDDDKTTEEETEEETTEENNDKEIEELETLLKEAQEELEKEKGKEKNFKNLKTAEQTKRMKLSERIERMEEQLRVEQENRQHLQDSIMIDAKGASLDQLAGDDKDLRQQLEERVKNSEAYLGAPKNSKELTERYESAYSYLQGSQKRVNPLHSYNPITGTQNEPPREKRFTDTKDGQQILKDKFPQIAAIEEQEKKKK